jgi:hypothetical protein
VVPLAQCLCSRQARNFRDGAGMQDVYRAPRFHVVAQHGIRRNMDRIRLVKDLLDGKRRPLREEKRFFPHLTGDLIERCLSAVLVDVLGLESVAAASQIEQPGQTPCGSIQKVMLDEFGVVGEILSTQMHALDVHSDVIAAMVELRVEARRTQRVGGQVVI